MKKPMKMVKKSPAKNLTAKQKKMDVNKNNRIDKNDLLSLRKQASPKGDNMAEKTKQRSVVTMKKASMAKMKKMKTSAATMKKAAMKLKKESSMKLKKSGMMMKKAAMMMKKAAGMKMKKK